MLEPTQDTYVIQFNDNSDHATDNTISILTLKRTSTEQTVVTTMSEEFTPIFPEGTMGNTRQ